MQNVATKRRLHLSLQDLPQTSQEHLQGRRMIIHCYYTETGTVVVIVAGCTMTHIRGGRKAIFGGE